MLNKYNPENDEKDNINNLKDSFNVIGCVIGSIINFDDDAAPTSTNPCVRINSMPIEENKIYKDRWLNSRKRF
jgi:hypothetical protein